MGAISGGTREARFLPSYYETHLSWHERLNRDFFLKLSRGRGKKPNNECEGESGMGVMSGRGELMASSLPLPASKIHPQIVCRASGETHHHLPPPSFSLHERFLRAEPTHDGRGFHTLGVGRSAVGSSSGATPLTNSREKLCR